MKRQRRHAERPRKEVNVAASLNETEYKTETLDFSKVKVGMKTLDDANFNIITVNRDSNGIIITKEKVQKAIKSKSYDQLRLISQSFFNINGIYANACRYLANLYRYDWYIIPYLDAVKTRDNISISAEEDNSENKADAATKKIIKQFATVLQYFNRSNIAFNCRHIALEVMIKGCYYGYLIDNGDNFVIQDLPQQYCRSRYKKNGVPVVEFNMKFFDSISDLQYRLKVLSTFPAEIQKAYRLYTQQKLKPDYAGDDSGWYLLDELAFKINIGDSDIPPLINAIPSILDLEEMQALDKKKMMQQLLKILIQKLPLDKNFDLVFDLEEARDLHNNAVSMLKRAVGVDVLTTFADVEVANTSDTNSTTKSDDLAKVERAVYNNFGFSQNIFNSDSNLALEKSTLVDEGVVRDFVLQFTHLYNKILKLKTKSNKQVNYDIKMLETTQFNYKDLSKYYKDLTSLGYSRMLPLVALGHSQSEIFAMATFENQVLNLTQAMIPPMSTNTMSASQILDKNKNTSTSKNQNNQNNKTVADSDAAKGGRPEKADNEKSEKTIANRESM